MQRFAELVGAEGSSKPICLNCGRRSFITLCLRKGMSPEDIRAVTSHATAGMMMKYVKFDDESKREKMNLLNNMRQASLLHE